ncbi:hypothetical protein E0Z10_g1916 [Xylaria hypoxylon]|uniref:T6SS Phospholipase effector Tle1-like catalytic domain-containing protein n=1 Tax=Xylaria hypoxylon TaxID=37992 RepID=A0A4Z0YS59_9PEZI|nr:hypothetical protein E0Z10_g1916 [Xylaria hypoxylon]
MGQNASTIDTPQRKAEFHNAVEEVRTGDVERILAQDPGSIINSHLDNGLTPLILAIEKGDSNLIHLLLVKGADPNIPDRNGQTALHMGAKQDDFSQTLQLISYGADVNAVTTDGKTVLGVAIEKGRHDVIADLIENGADTDVTSEQDANAIPGFLGTRPHPTRRRLIVCCDGTWHDNDTEDPLSNVARIAMCISSDDPNPNFPFTQILHYQSGVGTSAFALENLYEGAVASAISEDIRDAYSFICDNFTSHRDEIILIGFSRGAFTVRAVATLLHDIGVLRGAGRYCLSRLYNLWEKQMPTVSPTHVQHSARQPSYEKTQERKELFGFVEHLLINKLTRKGVKIKACAVWDTVSALGPKLPRRLPQMRSHKLAFVDSKLCPSIQRGFQALALDEKRFHFQPKLWVKHKPTQELKQCWFRGSHANIGGGISNFGLANLSLAWMICQLHPHVKFEESKIFHLEPNWTLIPTLLSEQPTRGQARLDEQSFRVYNTMDFWYKLAGSEIRTPGEYSVENETVHFSVFALDDPDPSQVISTGRLLNIRKEPVVELEKEIMRQWSKQSSGQVLGDGLKKLQDYFHEV